MKKHRSKLWVLVTGVAALLVGIVVVGVKPASALSLDNWNTHVGNGTDSCDRGLCLWSDVNFRKGKQGAHPGQKFQAIEVYKSIENLGKLQTEPEVFGGDYVIFDKGSQDIMSSAKNSTNCLVRLFEHNGFQGLEYRIQPNGEANFVGDSRWFNDKLSSIKFECPSSSTRALAAGAIRGLAGKCVDIAGAKSVNGATIQLYTCNGTNAQRWSRSADGTIRALGKCLDVSHGSTANGARVQLWRCNGSGAQRWRYQSGRLVNPRANKCLEVRKNNSANGTPLQLWSCTGAANQKWTVS
jgi:Ricin-type beta-trefoil lectin domain